MLPSKCDTVNRLESRAQQQLEMIPSRRIANRSDGRNPVPSVCQQPLITKLIQCNLYNGERRRWTDSSGGPDGQVVRFPRGEIRYFRLVRGMVRQSQRHLRYMNKTEIIYMREPFEIFELWI